MKRKIIASIVVLILFFGMLPIYSQASDELKNPRVINEKHEDIKFENGTSVTYEVKQCVTWDCVYFGSYWQKDSEGNIDKTKEKQPIKWQVLQVTDDDILLFCDDVLCKSAYYEEDNVRLFTWKDSQVRKWIQEEFINEAFTKEELNDIIETDTTIDDKSTTLDDDIITKDKVFVPSEDDMKNSIYGFGNIINHKSPYDLPCWLRTNATYVHGIKCIGHYNNVINDFALAESGIRPALHLKKSSKFWKKAGTVNTYDEINVERTPNPRPTMIPTPVPTPKKVIKKVVAPSIPQKVKVKNNKNKTVTITWSKVSGAKGYQVQYAYNAPFSKKTKKVSTNKFVAKKLKKKKIYSFRVRAYKMNGKKKLYGKWSKVVRIKIKK